VTPTNLLYNVISGPGALWRYRLAVGSPGSLTRTLLKGTLPGVVAGGGHPRLLVPGERAFRLVAAAVLLSIGLWLIKQSVRAVSAPMPF
jgi:hypothetical protein